MKRLFIEIFTLNKATGLANKLTKDPIIGDITTSSDGHTEEYDEEVSNGQVRDELVRHGLHAFVEENKIDDEEIADQADHEYNRVDEEEYMIGEVAEM